MKKNILTMMLFAVAAIASVSCQKEDQIAPAEPVTLTFTSANPETKTEWNEENQTIWWSDKDAIRVALKVGETWYADKSGAKLYQSTSLSAKSETGKFKLKNFEADKIAELGSYNFYALYPDDAADTNFDKSTSISEVTLPSVQTSSSETFDKSADILWGKTVDPYSALPVEEVPLLWNRLVAHAHITLKGINGIVENETINSVTLTAQEGAALTGKYALNVATGEFTPAEISNTVTVNCSDIVADASGNVTFWACINPCTVTSLNIVVDTDVATYTIDKQNLNLAFLQNQRNILPVNMSAAVHEQKAVDDTDYSGDWLITGTKTDGAMVAAGAYVSGNNINAIVGVTLTDGTFEYVDGIENCKMNIEKVTDGTYAGKYTIKDANGLYLYAAGANSNNYLKAASLDVNNSVFYWSISIVDGQPSSLVATGCDRNDLRFYKSSNYFSCYAANTTASKVTLYPYSMVAVSTTPKIVISSEEPIVVGAEAGEVTINYTIKNPVDDAGVQASTNVDWLTDVRYADGTVTYTVAENAGAEREAIVTLSYEGATPVEVVVTQEATVAPSSDVWALVTDASTLAVGDRIVIVAKEYNYAMGSDKGNNRDQVEIEKVDNNITITSDVQILTLEAGSIDNTFAFNTGTGYLCAASSSSNYLKTKGTKDANGSWKITISTEGVASIVAQGDYTKNNIKYNSASNGQVFSCYSTKQSDISIYKLQN